jgi:hypothetical protein
MKGKMKKETGMMFFKKASTLLPFSLFLLPLLGVLLASGERAEDDPVTDDTVVQDAFSPQIEVVDIPTAEVLDPMTYATTFRFYSDGGLTSRFLLAPLKRVNLGIALDAQRVIGAGDPHIIQPSVYFKVKALDEGNYFPAIALGYDNQGMLWNEESDEFQHREKGIFLVGSHAIFTSNLDLHGGVNVNEFDEDAAVYGFLGTTIKFTPNFALLVEYDNIRNGRDNRLNIGGRFWVAPYFNVDFAARNIPRGAERGGERILRLNYVGHFPI